MKKPITLKGKLVVEEELDHLIKIDREEIKSVIAKARALGDLKENADYHAAKEKQSMIEGRIQTLQGVLANAEVVDVSKINADVIVFGATVSLKDSDDIEISYQIVGDEETNMAKGKISYNSPIGRALIGKEEGDEVTVRAPKGDKIYYVESISYDD